MDFVIMESGYTSLYYWSLVLPVWQVLCTTIAPHPLNQIPGTGLAILLDFSNSKRGCASNDISSPPLAPPGRAAPEIPSRGWSKRMFRSTPDFKIERSLAYTSNQQHSDVYPCSEEQQLMAG